MELHPIIMQLTIGYTCVGVFVATALAVVLNLFNLIKIEDELKKKLHVVLILEIAALAVVSFSNLIELNPAPATARIEMSAMATADKLEVTQKYLRDKNLEGDQQAMLKALQQSVFEHAALFARDENLLPEALAILEKRGSSTAEINAQLLNGLPMIMQSKRNWLRDEAIPALTQQENEINSNPQNQYQAFLPVMLPDSLILDPEATSSILIKNRKVLEDEIALLGKYLGNQ